MTDSEWVTCRCGKERQITGDETARRIKRISTCRSCDDDTARAMNWCPETVLLPNGVSGCRLTYHHRGRCEPHEF